MITLILASTSPRRHDLLASLGCPFRVCAPDFVEKRLAGEVPAAYVRRNSLGKAMAVIESLAVTSAPRIVIAADTVVTLADTVLEKPHSPAHACEMLQRLSGTTHQVLTGMSLCGLAPHQSQPLVRSQVVATQVTFKPLQANEIEAYVETREPLDKAGSYGIQGKASYFVQRIDGSFTNVIGLPMSELYTELTELIATLAPGQCLEAIGAAQV